MSNYKDSGTGWINKFIMAMRYNKTNLTTQEQYVAIHMGHFVSLIVIMICVVTKDPNLVWTGFSRKIGNWQSQLNRKKLCMPRGLLVITDGPLPVKMIAP